MSSRRARSRPRPKKSKTKSTESPAPAPSARLALLGLGSNLGDRRAHIERALAEISRIAPVLATSSFYRTEPVGFEDQPAFWNIVAAIAWPGTPERLLALAKRVERTVGRTPSFRNGPREIDVDILDIGVLRRVPGADGGLRHPSGADGGKRRRADPILPHPRLKGRRFVLAPLAELVPGWRHPETGESAEELLRALPARPRQSVRRLSSRPRGSLSPAPGR
jgi:2-amino-4-hydroxy-6-hydroxymethyldihydropteridine diphosphokinase